MQALKLGERVENSERRLRNRVMNAVRERRETPEIARGPKAEALVRLKLYDHGFLSLKGPEGFVDIIALVVRDKTIKFPPEVIGIEVERVRRGSRIYVVESKLREPHGPFHVIVRETEPGYYAYLVLTHSEMASEMRRGEYREKRKRWERHVPKNLKGWEQYKGRWDKIAKERR